MNLEEPMQQLSRLILIATLALTTVGCATHVSQPAPIVASKVRFSEFQAIEMKPLAIAEKFAGNGANQKAKAKIEEILFSRMALAFPNLKRVEGEFSHGEVRTLQIEPHIKEIKFIGGAARFWAGAMAGSSAVLMDVTFRDSKTGAVVAVPEFLRVANAYAGAWSMGAADNQMLEIVAMDVVNYSTMNR